jgi:hypothetical protein
MLGQSQPLSTYHLPPAPILTVPIPNLPVSVAEKALESLGSPPPFGGMKDVSFFFRLLRSCQSIVKALLDCVGCNFFAYMLYAIPLQILNHKSVASARLEFSFPTPLFKATSEALKQQRYLIWKPFVGRFGTPLTCPICQCCASREIELIIFILPNRIERFPPKEQNPHVKLRNFAHLAATCT